MTNNSNPVQAKINGLFGLVALLIVGISVWLSLDNSQPIAQTISLWQISIMGGSEYYVALTAFVIAIPLLLVLVLLKVAVVKIYNMKNPEKPLKLK